MADNAKQTVSTPAKSVTAKSESVKPGNANPATLTAPATPPVTETVTEVKLSEAELKAMYDSLPEMFRDAVDKLNAEIEEHNGNIKAIKAADSNDPKLIKAEIFEQKSEGNKKLHALRTQELKLIEQIEAIRKEAYEIIDTDGLMPKELTPEAVSKLKSESGESLKNLRNQVNALEAMEAMMPMLKGKVIPLIKEIATQRGAAKTGGATASSGETIKRPRFKRIEINGIVEDGNGNKVYGLSEGKEKYTFSLASAYLRKQHKNFDVAAKDLTDAYYAGIDESNVPDEHTFTIPYTYKDGNGNEQTVIYTVKAYKG